MMQDSAAITISIIIPAYQAEETIDCAVRSAIALAGHSGEVIVVNDGSTDSTGYIARSCLRQCCRGVYIEQDNQGRSVARNTGIKMAQGRWIAFVDADDWVFPESMAQMHFAAENSDADIIVFRDAPSYRQLTGAKEVIDGTRLRDAIMRPSLAHETSIENYNLRTVWGKLYRAEAIRGLSFTPRLRFGEDALFNIAAYNHSQVELRDICSYRYDILTASTCNAFRLEDVDCLSRFVDAAFALGCDLDLDEQMINRMCVSEFLELFYRAGGSDVGIPETLRAFESLTRSTSRLSLGINPERGSVLETARAMGVLKCFRQGLQGLALRLERARGRIKTVVRSMSEKSHV